MQSFVWFYIRFNITPVILVDNSVCLMIPMVFFPVLLQFFPLFSSKIYRQDLRRVRKYCFTLFSSVKFIWKSNSPPTVQTTLNLVQTFSIIDSKSLVQLGEAMPSQNAHTTLTALDPQTFEINPQPSALSKIKRFKFASQCSERHKIMMFMFDEFQEIG